MTMQSTTPYHLGDLVECYYEHYNLQRKYIIMHTVYFRVKFPNRWHSFIFKKSLFIIIVA